MNLGRCARVSVLSLLLAASGGAYPESAVGASPPAPTAAIDPKASAELTRMADYLRTLQSFVLHAETTKDEMVNHNFKIERSAKMHVTVKRPDRLRADADGDEGARSFFYDGKSFTLYTKSDNYYATTEAPPTILDALEMLLQRYGVELPLLDVVYAAVGGNLGEAILEAGDIGPSRVAGVDCEHLAFRGNKVDWQLWIEKGDKPVPRKMVVTTRAEAAAPQFIAVLTWDVAPTIDDASFAFTPPEGAMRIPFRPLRDQASESRRAQRANK